MKTWALPTIALGTSVTLKAMAKPSPELADFVDALNLPLSNPNCSVAKNRLLTKSPSENLAYSTAQPVSVSVEYTQVINGVGIITKQNILSIMNLVCIRLEKGYEEQKNRLFWVWVQIEDGWRMIAFSAS